MSLLAVYVFNIALLEYVSCVTVDIHTMCKILKKMKTDPCHLVRS